MDLGLDVEFSQVMMWSSEQCFINNLEVPAGDVASTPTPWEATRT
jgi:hypothetical protein